MLLHAPGQQDRRLPWPATEFGDTERHHNSHLNLEPSMLNQRLTHDTKRRIHLLQRLRSHGGLQRLRIHVNGTDNGDNISLCYIDTIHPPLASADRRPHYVLFDNQSGGEPGAKLDARRAKSNAPLLPYGPTANTGGVWPSRSFSGVACLGQSRADPRTCLT